MKLGVIQPVPTDLSEAYMLLEQIASCGLVGLEPYFGTTNESLLTWSETEVDEFVAAAAASGISIPSLSVGVFNNDAGLIDADERERAVTVVRRFLRLTAQLGADTMLLCTYIQSEPNTTAKKENLIKVLRKANAVSEQLEVAVALESPLPAAELAGIVDVAHCDRLGVYYDLGNAIALGFDPAAEIATLGQRILSVHVKDSIQQLGGLHLGEGLLDLPAALAALRRIQYDGWLILETPGSTADQWREDIERLDDCWRSLEG